MKPRNTLAVSRGSTQHAARARGVHAPRGAPRLTAVQPARRPTSAETVKEWSVIGGAGRHLPREPGASRVPGQSRRYSSPASHPGITPPGYSRRKSSSTSRGSTPSVTSRSFK
eukprot:scaffold61628_cov74-Phaeocystis_antarctica.AAC.1